MLIAQILHYIRNLKKLWCAGRMLVLVSIKIKTYIVGKGKFFLNMRMVHIYRNEGKNLKG